MIAVLALVVVGFLLWQGRTIASRAGAVALGLILGGALGNLADRAFRGGGFFGGGVVDFIDLQWWPVFNVADSCVVVGGDPAGHRHVAHARREPAAESKKERCPTKETRPRRRRDRGIPAALAGERLDRVVAMLTG